MFDIVLGAAPQRLSSLILTTPIPTEEFERLADSIKPDIEEKCKIQMIPWLESDLHSMDKLFTPLDIERCEKTPGGEKCHKIENYNAIFADNESTLKRILVKAKPGCGKSTFVSKVACDWARALVRYFRLVLVITLKLVRPGSEFEKVIIEQHPTLYEENYQPNFIDRLLKQHGKDILIILDGYDEMANNQSIDNIIQRRKYRNINLMVTPRLEKTDAVEKYFNSTINIVGFTYESALDYVCKIISDQTLVQNVMAFTKKDHRDLWQTPIFLLFITILAQQGYLDFNAPFYTEIHNILCYIYKSYTHRAKLEYNESKMKETFSKLGKLAYQYMKGKTHFVCTEQKILDIIGQDGLNCGLLIRQKDRRVLQNPSAEYVFTFHHTVIQEVLVVDYETELIPRIVAQGGSCNETQAEVTPPTPPPPPPPPVGADSRLVNRPDPPRPSLHTLLAQREKVFKFCTYMCT